MPSLSLKGPVAGLRALVYAAFWIAVFWFLWRHRDRILPLLRNLLEQIRQAWRDLFGGNRKLTRAARSTQASGSRRVAFRSWPNPFVNGRAQQMTMGELVVHSFEALQAWAAERQVGRQADQTPLEFGAQLARQAPELAEEVLLVTQLYARLAYASHALLPEARGPIEQLWRKMATFESTGSPSTVSVESR